MSEGKKQKSRQQLAMERGGEKKKEVPEFLNYGIIFFLTFPPVILFLVVTGMWDSKLIGGQALQAIAEGSLSMVLDVVLSTISILGLPIGNLLYYVSKRYMED